MAGKGGGAWKVAYADFVTAMMAFFLVMWITPQSKPVKESIARYFEDPMGNSDKSRLTSNEGMNGAAIFGPNEMGGANTRGLADSDPNSPPRPDGKSTTARKPPKLRIFYDLDLSQARGTMVLFDETSAELDDEACAQIDTLAPALRGKPNKIEIRGHSTGHPLPDGSPYRTQWELCAARCAAVMRRLEEDGIAPERFRLSQEANYEPYSDQKDADWRRLNSRVEIYATSEFIRALKNAPNGEGGFFGTTPAAHPTKPAAH